MMKKVTLLMLLCCTFMLPAFAQFSYVPVTGYNTDIVADGAVGAGSFSTTGSADVAVPPYVFVSTTFNPGSGVCASGVTALPASQTITSTNTTNNTGITYTLQSYGNGTATNNNVLQLANNITGTLTLTTPISAAKLYLVCLGGSGASSFTAVVNFTDATSQTITNSPAAPDWCGGATTYRLTSQVYYRINNNATTCTGGTCQYLYEIPVTIAGSNYGKLISSVTLTNNSTGTLFNVFAVGAQAACAAPAAQPTALTLTPGLTQVAGSFTAATGAPTGYLVVRYAQGAVTTPPDNGTTYTAGQALGLGTVVSAGSTTTFNSAGLTTGTAYTYYIYSYNITATCGGPVYRTTAPLTGSTTTNTCGTLSGTVPVGPGLPNTPAGGFTSLTNALNYIANNGIGGNTTLALQSGYVGTSANETFPITFPVNPCIGATKTLTVRPATGVTGLNITGTVDGAPLIDFNGATYVTIDGVNNGLTISNASVSSNANTATIRFINDAVKCTVTNCTVLGSATGSLSTNTGTIYLATGITTGNDSLAITNCKIGSVGANLPSKAIYSQGSTASAVISNSVVLVNGNELYDFFLTGGSAGVYANTGNSDWTITNNKIYQTATRTYTAAGTMYGIYFTSGTYGQNVQINSNTIGYASNTATGTLTLDGSTVSGAFTGITFTGLSSGTPACNINNNIISAISLTSSAGAFSGIVNATGVSGNTININSNQITNIALVTTTATSFGISWGSATNFTMNGNTINNFSRTGTGTIYGMYSNSSSANETVNNNILSNFSSIASGASSLYGIYQNTAAGTKVYQNNQTFNFSGSNGTTIYGIRVGYGTTIDISNNQIYALNSTGGTSGNIYGISTGTVGTLFNVYKNKVYNLTMSSTGGVVYGIYNATSATNIYNNLVGDLSSTAFTSTSSPYLGLAGIYISSGNSNIYNNTVRIGATTATASTNFSTAGIYASTSPTVVLQNNLVVNLATPVGSGKTVGYQRSSTTLNTYSSTSGSNSFYSGTPGAANVMFWDGTNAYQDLTSFRTAMAPRDQYSLNYNPSFVSTTGSAATYLHITPAQATVLESAGLPVALFNTDYDGDARPGPAGSVSGGAINYDIGADEFDGIPVFTCVQPAPGNTLSTATTICNGSSITLSLQNATPGNGITYKWYSSTDGTNYNQIAGANAASLTLTPIASAYYRAVVTCGTSLSATSTAVLVSFTNDVTTVTPGQRCGTGTVTLGATASAGTLNWYTAATGGFSIASGTSFVTPVLSATTPYYVAAESINPATTYTLGAGATTGSNYDAIFYHLWGGVQNQFLIRASELTALGFGAGAINSLGINMNTVTSTSYAGFAISIAATTNTDMSAGLFNGTFAPVYTAATVTPVTGTNTFTFSGPYNWDGVSNLIVKFCWSNNNTGGTSNYAKLDAPGFTSCAYYRNDSQTPAAICGATVYTGTTSNRPQFYLNGQSICASPRKQVTATVNTAPVFTVTPNQTICNNAITPLTITSTVGNYTNYTWSPATNLYTNAAATTAYVAGANAPTVYLKSATAGDAVYTANASNSTTLCAAVTTTTQTILPAAVTAIATPASLCYTGTTTLALVPATGYGAATFQWQSSPNNTTFTDVGSATNPTYATPVTTTSTYYRATIKNSAGAVCLNTASDTARVYAPAVTTTTPAARCGPGTLTLSATGVDGTLKWFTAATGGTALASGPSYTTPSLSATTTYYVGTESSPNNTAAVGTGSTTQGTSGLTPLSQTWEGIRTQFLILASDMITAGFSAGSLNSLAFNVSTKASTLPYTNYTVKLGSTSTTNLTGYLSPTFATVYGPSSYTSVAGLNTFAFGSPYTWDGTSNLVVEVCYANDPTGAGTFWTSNDVVTANSTSYTSTWGQYADNNDLCGTTASGTVVSASVVPQITFGQLGCVSNRTAVTATVNPLPTPTISPAGPVNICQGATTTLTGGGGGTYQWRNAAGNIGGATNSTYTTGNAGTYRVIVTTPATGCKDTSVAVTVNVNPLPVVNLGNDTTFCSGNTLTLNAGNTGSTFLWNNATTNQTRAVTTTGTYWVRVTNANTCQKTDTINVTVNPTPVVDLGNDTNLCQGVNFVLNSGNPTATTRLWDNGTTAQTRIVSSTGTYYVRVTNSFNCTARDTIVTTFLPSPSVNLGADIDACVGSTVTIDAGNPGETYLWDNASTLQTRNVTGTGTYYVTVKNIANCKGSDTVLVTFHALPVVNLGNDTTFCYANTLTLDAANPGASYLWNTNSTNQTIDVNTTGNYSVVVTDIYSCVGSDNINILIKDPPSGIINAVHGDTATYTFNILNPQYVTGYTWNFGDGSPTVSGPVVQHRYSNNGIYTVSVVLQGECSDSLGNSRTVDVYDATGGTGINPVTDSKELILYPNPARDLVVIENKKNLRMKQVTLYNVVGQVLSSTVADSPDKHKLNTSGLASGVYTIRIETDKGFVIRKFEIMK